MGHLLFSYSTMTTGGIQLKKWLAAGLAVMVFLMGLGILTTFIENTLLRAIVAALVVLAGWYIGHALGKKAGRKK